MKKILTTAILFVILMMMAITVVNAATSENLADQLYAIGAKYGMTVADKVKMQRYLNDNPLSQADCNQIVSLAKEATAIMDANGTTDYKTLPADIKSQLVSLANQAATIAGVTLDFKADRIDVYKDGKLIDTSSNEKGKLAYTGNNVTPIIVVSSVAVVALATAFVIGKKTANA